MRLCVLLIAGRQTKNGFRFNVFPTDTVLEPSGFENRISQWDGRKGRMKLVGTRVVR